MPNTNDEKQIIVFYAGGEAFGISIDSVKEITKIEQITRVPNTEAFIKGVINLRGSIIVVTDLATRLGLQSKKYDEDSRIIIVDINRRNWGIIVDSATEVIRYPKENIKAAPGIITQKINANFLQGVAVSGKQTVIMLDISNLLWGSNHPGSGYGKAKDNINNLDIQQPKMKNEIAAEINNLGAGIKVQEGKITDVMPEFHFITHEGGRLKNIIELMHYINSLSKDRFRNFVNEEKNDFYNWIKHAVKDEALAEKIRNARSAQELSSEIMGRVSI